jgi:thymidine kinase
MKVGIIEVIYGPMFAGKTSELIRQIEMAMISKLEILVFKPKIDGRYKKDEICTNNGQSFKSKVIKQSTDIVDCLKKTSKKIDKVFIDEVQFFDEKIVEVVTYLSKEKGIDVVLAGLALDFKGVSFGQMPKLLGIAQKTKSLTAICVHENEDGSLCRKPAYFTQRLVNGKPASYNDPTILVDGLNSYTARCEEHWFVPDRPETDLWC